jgi:class 3 adenylate cyclase/streptogramin lyase
MQRRTSGRGLGAVLFTDIVGSTAIAAEMGNTRWGELVSRHHRIVRRLISRHGGNEIDTAGDGFFIAFERPADAIRCAVEATEAVRGLGIEIRAGVSFGELETVGRKPGGLVVNTAARVMSVAGSGEVLVPASVREIVPGAGFTFAEHGVHQLKGLDGEFRLFGVTGIDGREVVPPLEEEEAAQRRREIFPAGGRRWASLVGVAASVLALIVAAWLVWGGEEPKEVPRGLRESVAKIDVETGRVDSTVFLGGAGGDPLERLSFIDHPVAVGEGGVWLLRPPFVFHIDPLHQEVRSQVDVEIGQTQTVVTGLGAVWSLAGATLYRINPATDEAAVALQIPIPSGITTFSLALSNVIWVASSDGTLVRLDPRTGALVQADTGLVVDGLAATRDAVWVADVLAGGVIRVDPTTLRQVGEPIEVRGTIDQIIGRGDSVWVLDKQVGTVTRIDAASGTVEGSTRVGDEATDMAIGEGVVWVGDRGGSLYRLNVLTLDVDEFPLGAEVLGVGVDEAAGSVWAYLGKAIRVGD